MSTISRIIFAGTNDFSAHHLSVLQSCKKNKIITVLTKPDRPSGRGKKIRSTPVKILAEKEGLPVFQPKSLYSKEVQNFIKKINSDIIIVVSYGLTFPKKILEIPRLGCINVHGSLLPRWRGAAPIERSILAGDRKTGITIIKMDVGLDTGDIIHQSSCLISSNETSKTLYEKLAKIGSKALIKVLFQLETKNFFLKKQKINNNRITYAKKISRKEARINWSLSAIEIERSIRAFNPWPISWLEINKDPVKIWKASVIKSDDLPSIPGEIVKVSKEGILIATKKDLLNLEELQFPGRKIVKIKDFLNSKKTYFIPGKILS